MNREKINTYIDLYDITKTVFNISSNKNNGFPWLQKKINI